MTPPDSGEREVFQCGACKGNGSVWSGREAVRCLACDGSGRLTTMPAHFVATPLVLAQRILAALERHASCHGGWPDNGATAIAAELRERMPK
jgi:phage major head subunit gpT-like protein